MLLFLPFDLLNKLPIYAHDKTRLYTNTTYYKSSAVNPFVIEGLRRHRIHLRENMKRPQANILLLTIPVVQHSIN